MSTPPPNGLDADTIANIRAVLADGGVLERDLEWMSRSCPGLAAARDHVEYLRRKGVKAKG